MLRQRLRPSHWRIRSLSLGGAVLFAATTVPLLSVSVRGAKEQSISRRQGHCFNPAFHISPEEERLTIPAVPGGEPE
jgi:hypothetical protein